MGPSCNMGAEPNCTYGNDNCVCAMPPKGGPTTWACNSTCPSTEPTGSCSVGSDTTRTYAGGSVHCVCYNAAWYCY
jgi:hypothetical protein